MLVSSLRESLRIVMYVSSIGDVIIYFTALSIAIDSAVNMEQCFNNLN